MPIIIDTNCIANVFSSKSKKHSDFEPVLKWIIKGKGIMLYGGSKYRKELASTPKYLPIIRLLKEVGKAIEGNKDKIDQCQEKIEKLINDDDFDDPHIPAICIVTKSILICSEDTRSIPFVTDNRYYPKGFITPVYYTSIKNKNILSDKYIDKSLKPLCKLNKLDKNRIERILK
ncbi:hypothetical protein [Ascidiimonas sp. W6]|uniref:hypothetical protein n=1 Tax=Ascidiimonas meishanensis TaxID=3128903 RepID=UPI0030EC4E29